MLAQSVVLLAALAAGARADSALYHALPQDGNLAYSPLAVEIFLRETADVAQGPARRQLENALATESGVGGGGAGGGGSAIADYMRVADDIAAYDRDSSFEVNSAFFVDKNAQLQSNAQQVAERYRSQVQSVDYENNADAARGDLVRWLTGSTHGLIADADIGVSARTRLALLGAAYFKALFATPFLPYDAPVLFHNLDGTTSPVAMIHRQLRVPYGRLPALGGAHVVAIPYKTEHLDLYVVLPARRDGLRALEEQMRSVRVPGVHAQLKRQAVNVRLPRFAVASHLNLKAPLVHQGVRDVFAPGALPLVAGAPCTLWQETHAAYFSLFERGTEAAAATEGAFVGGNALPAAELGPLGAAPSPAHVVEGPAVPFVADYPFLYYVVDRRSGETLYQGRVALL